MSRINIDYKYTFSHLKTSPKYSQKKQGALIDKKAKGRVSHRVIVCAQDYRAVRSGQAAQPL